MLCPNCAAPVDGECPTCTAIQEQMTAEDEAIEKAAHTAFHEQIDDHQEVEHEW